MNFGVNKGKSFFTAILVLTSVVLRSQPVYFADAYESVIQNENFHRAIIPQQCRTVSLNTSALKNFLWSLPAEQNLPNRNNAPVLSLPMPDGTMVRFRVWEYSMMEPGLAAKFPDIKTFAGYGIDDPYATLRMDYNPASGFSAQILSVHGDVYIDPYAKGDAGHCISYYAEDYHKTSAFRCITPGDSTALNAPENIQVGRCRGTVLFTYRLAVACTGEYAIAVCSPNPPSVAATMAAIITTINRVNAVYEKELAMRFLLVANNDQLVFLNPATDPYSNGNAAAMLDENQATVNSIIGFSNYDLGQVLGTGNMGMAAMAAVCSSPNKAKAVSGLPNPTGDLFDVDRVCHNLAHLFNARHTYNSTESGCGDGPALPGEEPGSGTTIMASAGSCGPDNLQPQADPYFHVVSFNQISEFLITNAAICRNIIPNGGNVPPRIISMPIIGFNIPQATPFILNALATDDNGDPITYCWETTDRGPLGPWNGGNTVGSPFFKSRTPKTTGSRTFPDIDVILAGYPPNPPPVMGGLKGETIPLTFGNINFLLTVRDNRGGVMNDGADCHNALFQIGVYRAPGTGPFKVTLPDGGETWSANSQQLILWDVAGTTASPILNNTVNILLSGDGGYTYPFFLAAGVPNDGFEVVTMPNISTTTARIKVEAAQNIFFDISNGNFSIAPAPVGFEFGIPALQIVACPGPSSVSFSLGTISNGGYSTPVTLSASGAPPGTTVSFGANPIVPGNASTVTLNNLNTLSPGRYFITVTGQSGSLNRSRVLVLDVQTGTAPVITRQPQPVEDCRGASVTFSISATGASSYQWQVNFAGGPFSDIPGANSTTLIVNNIQPGNFNLYRCVVRNQCNFIVSNAVGITAIAGLQILTHPQNVTVCSGTDVVFNTTATVPGTTPLYQWQVNRNDGAGFISINGAVTNTLSLSNVVTAMNGYQYRCLVFNPNCTSPTPGNVATLSVNPSPAITISAAPYNNLLPGLQTTLSASVIGGTAPYFYRWYLNNALLPGFISSALAIDFRNPGNYRAEVSDARGCVGQSNIVIITDSASNKFFIFPNPARSLVEFAFYNPGGQSVNWQLSIFNSSGMKVLQDAVFNAGYYPRMIKNVTTWARVVYLVVLTDNAGNILGKGKLLVH